MINKFKSKFFLLNRSMALKIDEYWRSNLLLNGFCLFKKILEKHQNLWKNNKRKISFYKIAPVNSVFMISLLFSNPFSLKMISTPRVGSDCALYNPRSAVLFIWDLTFACKNEPDGLVRSMCSKRTRTSKYLLAYQNNKMRIKMI